MSISIEESTAKRTIADASIETRLLVTLLGAAQPGDIVSYESMEATAGVDCRPGMNGYGKLGSARRRALADLGFVFLSVKKVGLRRCHENEKPKVLAGVSDQIHRAARRGIKIASTTDISQLSNLDKIEFNLRTSQLGAMKAFTGAKATKRLQSAVTKADAELPLTKTLESTLAAFK